MTGRTLPTGLVLATLGLLLGAVLLGSNRLALPWVVGGRSMTPTIQPGDHLIVDLWTYRYRAPRPGELVLFRAPTSSGATLLKRAAVAPPFPDDRPRPGLWPGEGSAREPGVWLLGGQRRRQPGQSPLRGRSAGPGGGPGRGPLLAAVAGRLDPVKPGGLRRKPSSGSGCPSDSRRDPLRRSGIRPPARPGPPTPAAPGRPDAPVPRRRARSGRPRRDDGRAACRIRDSPAHARRIRPGPAGGRSPRFRPESWRRGRPRPACRERGGSHGPLSLSPPACRSRPREAARARSSPPRPACRAESRTRRRRSPRRRLRRDPRSRARPVSTRKSSNRQ